MRVLLKRKKTGRYYRGPNQFASEPGEALDFASIPAAARFALTEHLAEVEIALRSDYLAQEVPLPVLREWCELDENHRLQGRDPTPPARLPIG